MENATQEKVEVSIIVPLYNAEKYIAQTIESVLIQTYNNWELIIVDDCSNDESCQIVSKYAEQDKRISLYHMNKNSGGPAAPRNLGIEKAVGNYIAFLDADDIWLPQKLEAQLRFLAENHKGFTSSDCIYIGADSELLSNDRGILFLWRKKRKQKKTIKDLIQNNFIITSSVLIEAGYLKNFDEADELVAVEDLCMWLYIFHEYQDIYFYQKEPLVKYRILDNSISERSSGEKQNVKMLLCLMRFFLENDLSHYLDNLKWSLCKSRIAKWLKI